MVPANSGDASGWLEEGSVIISVGLKGNVLEGKNSYRCSSEAQESGRRENGRAVQ